MRMAGDALDAAAAFPGPPRSGEARRRGTFPFKLNYVWTGEHDRDDLADLSLLVQRISP
jgi:hypothetical protein